MLRPKMERPKEVLSKKTSFLIFCCFLGSFPLGVFAFAFLLEGCG